MKPNPNTIKNKKEEIMKGFDSRFTAVVGYVKWPDSEAQKLPKEEYVWNDVARQNPNHVKSFLSQAIDEAVKEERERVRKIVEGMRKKMEKTKTGLEYCGVCDLLDDGCGCDKESYNQALDDILSQLGGKEE